MIVDLTELQLRARILSLYYLIRSFAITPSALAGGVPWKIVAQVPFWVARGIGLTSAFIFAATADEPYAA